MPSSRADDDSSAADRSATGGVPWIVNDPAKQPVYVHGVGGRHRTGVMTAAYRMTDDGWSADQAFKEMKQFNFGADFLHSEFKAFVYGYRPEPAAAVTSSASRP